MNQGLINIPENLKAEITVKLEQASLIKLGLMLLTTVVFWGIMRAITK